MSMSKIERYRSKLKEFDAKRGKFWKPEDGRNQIRILPPINPDDDFYEETKQHFIPGAGEAGTNGLYVGCSGDDCRVCRLLSKLEESNDPECNQLAEKAKAKSSYLLNIVDIKNMEKGTQVWRHASDRVMSDLIGFICDPEWGEFFDRKEGRVVNIKSEKAGASIRYTTSLNPKTSPIDKEFLSQRKDLKKLISKDDPAQLSKAVSFLREMLGDNEDLISAKDRLKKKSKFRDLKD